jgi:hypothetical protein
VSSQTARATQRNPVSKNKKKQNKKKKKKRFLLAPNGLIPHSKSCHQHPSPQAMTVVRAPV